MDVRPRSVGIAAALSATLLAPVAFGHGTVNMLRQSAEHEKITRTATECGPRAKNVADLPGRCFEQESEDQLAGTSTQPASKAVKKAPKISLKGPSLIAGLEAIIPLKVGTVGAVGSPDIESFFEDTPHCTAGDYLADDYLIPPATYPRTRADAEEALLACHNLLIRHFRLGLDIATKLVAPSGRIRAKEVELPCDPIDARLAIRGFTRFSKDLDRWLDANTHGKVAQAPLVGTLRKFLKASENFYSGDGDEGAKCRVIGRLGKMMHGMQDFYSHGNWADRVDDTRDPGLDNPPGLDQSGRAPLLNMLVDVPPVDPGLVTACFGFLPGQCKGRIDHDKGLGKDLGKITIFYGANAPNTFGTANPQTPRGKVRNNFSLAVGGAVRDSHGAWKDFGNELIRRYGQMRGTQMICAITHDDPVKDCVAGQQIDTVVGAPIIEGGDPTSPGPGDGSSGGEPN